MKMEGSYIIAAPREVVWQHLLHPEFIARALPGCEKIEPDGEGSYRVQLKVGIAAVRGTYTGRVQILDPEPPLRYRMRTEATSRGSFLKGEALITLSEHEGKTLVSYSGDGQVGGMIASAGQRLIQGAARQNVNQFFESLARQVANPSG